jgi:hypothetical protein
MIETPAPRALATLDNPQLADNAPARRVSKRVTAAIDLTEPGEGPPMRIVSSAGPAVVDHNADPDNSP